MELVWEKDYRIRIYEVSGDGRIHLPVIMDLMQDAASEHAGHLGLGVEHLTPMGISWFLAKVHIELDEYPKYGDILKVTTWPKKKRKVFAYRDFKFSVSGRDIGAASSIWCLVDLEKRSLIKPSDHLPGLPERKVDALETAFPSISALSSYEYRREVQAGLTDLDLNRHVNNTAYSRWGINTLPPDLVNRYSPVRIDAVFKDETSLEEKLLSDAVIQRRDGEILTVHRIGKKDSEKDAFRMRIEWKV